MSLKSNSTSDVSATSPSPKDGITTKGQQQISFEAITSMNVQSSRLNVVDIGNFLMQAAAKRTEDDEKNDVLRREEEKKAREAELKAELEEENRKRIIRKRMCEDELAREQEATKRRRIETEIQKEKEQEIRDERDSPNWHPKEASECGSAFSELNDWMCEDCGMDSCQCECECECEFEYTTDDFD
jgi:hypothetical protein